jgi:thioesterase domain-containing protein
LIEERGGSVQDSGVAAEDQTSFSDFRYIVPMASGQSQATPFFMIAGMFGNVLNLRHLAQMIGVDRSFYGLQARGLFGAIEPHESLVDAASDYIEEIRRIQPEGPYMVGGFSGGGITAYEIAHQLREAGQDVTALILLDTPLPQRRSLNPRDRAMLQWLKFREEGFLYPARWARRRIEWELELRKQAPYETDEMEFHNASIRAAFERAIAKYKVKSWNGAATLFRPPLSKRYEVAPGRYLNENREYVHPTNEWSQYVPNLKVIEVPGDHDSMVLEPNVRVLATHLRTVLTQAETTSPSQVWRKLRAAE